MSKLPYFRYLSAWFCPYAHRATIALEHHASRVSYEWVEALGWKQQTAAPINDTAVGDKSANSTTDGVTTTEWYYHWKAEELKRVNPSALVPTLIPTNLAAGLVDESKAVYESLVVVDYIDLVAGASDKDRLVPFGDPYQYARCRIWADKVNRECCSPYYGVLVRTDAAERRAHFEQLLNGLVAFARELSSTPGPTFLPHGQLSSVDVALVPWAFRYYVLEHYRGPEYAIPRDRAELQPYFAWYDHVMQLESVQRTLPDKERYLDHIRKYADGSARSKVANAVRRGVAAHELDDAKDEY
jgi:glutathione S-transferase